MPSPAVGKGGIICGRTLRGGSKQLFCPFLLLMEKGGGKEGKNKSFESEREMMVVETGESSDY